MDPHPFEEGVETKNKFGFFFHSALRDLRSSVALRVTCCAPAMLWLAVIDFQNGDLGQISFTVDS